MRIQVNNSGPASTYRLNNVSPGHSYRLNDGSEWFPDTKIRLRPKKMRNAQQRLNRLYYGENSKVDINEPHFVPSVVGIGMASRIAAKYFTSAAQKKITELILEGMDQLRSNVVYPAIKELFKGASVEDIPSGNESTLSEQKPLKFTVQTTYFNTLGDTKKGSSKKIRVELEYKEPTTYKEPRDYPSGEKYSNHV